MSNPLREAQRVIAAFLLVLLLTACASHPEHSVFQLKNPSFAAFVCGDDQYLLEDINGPLPEKIFLKTRTQSFNSYHYYSLKSGLIWYKGLSLATGPSEWTLFMKTGLPHNENEKDFQAPQKIVEISADGDELFALSEEGRFYRIVFDKGYSRKKNYWYDSHGWPATAPLLMEGSVTTNRGWVIGKRNRSVRYYEDIFGNQHHYGTIGILTNYVLLDDGQEIRFADVGLPSDFSRTLVGPERGAFIAENISASASTIFLIGAAGEMYTRLADFDTIGCDPMFFKYTYRPYVSKLRGKDYRSNYEPWGLPGEDWRMQPKIPLQGRAAISRRITILQNGQGNKARELRVAGRDAEGMPGYWSKPIFGDSWSFVRAPLHINAKDFLHPEAYTTGRGPRGPIADVRLTGSLWRDGRIVEGWSFEIPDFNILEGSCKLRIGRGNERAEIILHPVEAWSYHKRDLPGRDGTPKPYLGTIEIPAGGLDGLSDYSRAELERCFLSDDRELFSYLVEATTDYILIEPRDRLKRGYTLFLTASGDSTVPPDTFRVAQLAPLSEYERYASDELALPSAGPFFTRDLPAIRMRIAENERLKAELETRIRTLNTTRRRSLVSRFAYSAFSFVTHATLLYRIDFPKVYTLTLHGGAIMELNDDQIDLVAGTRAWLDTLLLDLIKARIRAYSATAHKLEGDAAAADLPPGFAETYRHYMAAAGLPSNLNGRFKPANDIADYPEAMSDGTLRACLRPTTLNHDFPGWILEVGDEPAFALLVELENVAGKIFERRGVNPDKKTLKLHARLHLVSTGTAEHDRDLYRDAVGDWASSDSGVPATVRWNGETLIIKHVSESSANILFRGRLSELF